MFSCITSSITTSRVQYYNKYYLLPTSFILILLAALFSYSPVSAAAAEASAAQSGATHYVSKNGSNQGGGSWQNAWNEMNQIDWNQVSAGDTILIDGGSDGMTYSTGLDIGRSGYYGQPIKILVSDEWGRDGKVTLHGGRSQKLPYCGQSDFYDESNLHWFGIRTNDHSWIEIDGRDWRGLSVHGFEKSGIRIDRGSTNITIRNVEAFNNGYAKSTSSGWEPEGVGVRLAGENILLERAIIYDNGQDAIQSLWLDNNIKNFRMNYTWLHNSRRHPTVDQAFNYCTHTDGIQIYDGGVIQDITIENSIVGPGFTQPLIMGQSWASNGAWADVQNVVIRDTIITKATDNAVYGYRNSDSRNWNLERVTLDCATTTGQCLYLMNRDHTVRDSVIYKGRVIFPNGMINQYYNNCAYENIEYQLGRNANPQFAQVNDGDRFSLDDYSIPSNSECAGLGSRITSVEQLLGAAASVPATTTAPTSTPVPTSTPTSTPVSTPVSTPSPTSTPTSTAAPTATAEPPTQGSGTASCGSLVQEAEYGDLSGDFTIQSSGSASSGQYIVASNGNRGSSPDNGQKATYCFNVPSDGHYYVKGWVYAASKYDNSFYVKVDGSPSSGYVWHTKINFSYNAEYATQGDGYTKFQVYLSAGTHNIEIYLREDGTRLDKIGLESVESASIASSRSGLTGDQDEGAVSSSPQEQDVVQWLSGTVQATQEHAGLQRDGLPLLLDRGLAVVDADTNGESIYLSIQLDADGSYYLDAVPAGRYKLQLPLGYGFVGGQAPEFEVTPNESTMEELEFSFYTEQTFLPLLQ